jgi:hypothetical protein
LALDREPDAQRLSRIDFELDGGAYVFETHAEQGRLVPACPPLAGLSWNVELARARGQLRRLDRHAPTLAGTCYADWVELTRWPRALGLVSLEWGRLHLEAGTVVYTEARRSSGPPFRAASLWARGCCAQPIADWTLAVQSTEGARRLRFGRRGDAFEAELVPQRALHLGAAADRARFPSVVEQTFYRALAGPMHEQRWLSRAHSSSFGDGVAVHECVRFGAGPAR